MAPFGAVRKLYRSYVPGRLPGWQWIWICVFASPLVIADIENVSRRKWYTAFKRPEQQDLYSEFDANKWNRKVGVRGRGGRKMHMNVTLYDKVNRPMSRALS